MTRHRSCASLLVAVGFLAFAFLPDNAQAADKPAAANKAATDKAAADKPAAAAEIPAILASLDARDVKVLDDGAAQAVRGQAGEYLYVLVRILGLNTFDFAPGIEWTLNPYAYRYGAWGGPSWTNGGQPLINPIAPADSMDALFQLHDQGTLNDLQLVGALSLLPNVGNSFWGQIYVPAAAAINPVSGLPVGTNVWVAGGSFIGGKFYFGWRPMPFTEYSRRQALTGMQLLAFLP